MGVFWNVVSNFLTAVAIFAVIYWSRKQFNQMQEQLGIQINQTKHSFFADYTERYQEIILNFPENVNDDSFSFDKLPQDLRDKTMRYMRVYFDLCSEEYYLNIHRWIDDFVWKEWCAGMQHAFRKKAFRDAWSIIQKDTGFYREFADFVGKVMRERAE